MSNNRKVIAGMIAAAALAVSGSLVYAQPQQPGGDSGVRGERHGMTGHGMRGGHERHGQWSNPAARVEGYLAALKVELKITPAQEKAWQTFADKTRKQAEARAAQRAKFAGGKKPADNVPAPERLAQRTAFMKQALASMEARTAAVTELYAALTPEQKAIADKQFARGHGGGFHRGGHDHQPKA